MAGTLYLGRFEVRGPRDHAAMRGFPAAYTWALAHADDAAQFAARVTAAMQQDGLIVASSEQIAPIDAAASQPAEITQLLREALRAPEFVHHTRLQHFEDTGTHRPMLLELKTARMRLRPWQRTDRDAFAALNADPHVMHYAPRVLSRRESDALVDEFLAEFHHNGFSLLVAELRDNTPRNASFIGVMGLRIMRDILPSLPQPSVELTLRVARAHQRQGLAAEGGRALLKLAFDDFQLHEVIAAAAVANAPCRTTLDRIGMRPRANPEFEHGRYPPRHLYARHVLYSALSPHSSH